MKIENEELENTTHKLLLEYIEEFNKLIDNNKKVC